MLPAGGIAVEELAQDGLDLGDLLAHADQPGDIRRRADERAFMQVVGVQHAAVGEVLHRTEMPGVRGVVADVELVEVHSPALASRRPRLRVRRSLVRHFAAVAFAHATQVLFEV
jgi:hypothetical protein